MQNLLTTEQAKRLLSPPTTHSSTLAPLREAKCSIRIR